MGDRMTTHQLPTASSPLSLRRLQVSAPSNRIHSQDPTSFSKWRLGIFGTMVLLVVVGFWTQAFAVSKLEGALSWKNIQEEKKDATTHPKQAYATTTTIPSTGFLFQAFESAFQHVMTDGQTPPPQEKGATRRTKVDAFPSSCDFTVERHEYDAARNASAAEICEFSKNRTNANGSIMDRRRYCYPRQIAIRCSDTSGGGGLHSSDGELLAREFYYAESILEIGIGESTRLAAETNVPRYVGVDSSDAWIAAVRKEMPERFRFYMADVGSTERWGRPKGSDLPKSILNYPLKLLWSELYPFDVYFIDGRYRIACAALCFLHALETSAAVASSTLEEEEEEEESFSSSSSARVLMHDYMRRKQYDIMELVATVVDRSDRMVVLKLKPETTRQELFELWNATKNIVL